MHNIQKIHVTEMHDYFNAIEITFPDEVAEQILSEMENLFGTRFQNLYGHVPTDELRQTLCRVLNGITPFQLSKGIERMRSAKSCPVLPDFGLWCREQSEFWSEQVAWVKAVNFLNNPKAPITVLAKQALDEVYEVLRNEGQIAAGFSFREIYKSLVEDAIVKGEEQVMWRKSMIAIDVPKADSMSLLEKHNTDRHRQISEIQRELMARGVTPKQARIEAQHQVQLEPSLPINKLHHQAHQKNRKLTPFQQLIQSGKSISEAFMIAKNQMISKNI